jgi:hypothetical protein
MEYYVDVCEVHLIYGVIQFQSFFVDFLSVLSIGDRGVLKSPNTTVLECISVFKSSRVCLMKLGTPTLGAYKLTIVISS